MGDRAWLGVSWRWVRERPDEPLVFDSFGYPHTAVFVTNHGSIPARDVRFVGACQTFGTDPTPQDVRAFLTALPFQAQAVCNPASAGALPLYYHLHGTEQVGDRVCYAFGRITYDPGDGQRGPPGGWLTFCARWNGAEWERVGEHNDVG